MTQGVDRRVIVLGVAAAALAGGAGILIHNATSAPDDAMSRLGAGLDDVVLLGAGGEEVRWGALKGRPRVVFFGFTHCPVICPVTVWELNDAMDRIGAPAEDLAIEFVTIDPARDTPERLSDYFSGFGARVRGYSGTPEAIARIAGGFEVVYRRNALEGEDYTMDHTATVFLIDSRGHVADVLAYGSPPEVIEARLRTLVGASAN
jgi:protein SCO1/2